jgi:hypothetical protein
MQSWKPCQMESRTMPWKRQRPASSTNGACPAHMRSARTGVRHEATADEMALDAKALGIPAGKLIPVLQALWDLEKEYALRRQWCSGSIGEKND